MTITDLLPIANHLWQSTLFAVAVCVLTLMLRKNRAAVRHRLWLASSIKFLIPFSVLINIGSHFQWRTVSVAMPPAVSTVVGEMGAPFAVSQQSVPDRLPTALLLLWMVGVGANIAWWFVRWLQLRWTMRRARPLNLDVSIPVMSCPERFDPGVLGVLTAPGRHH
jgi:bla regulator protein BlaR1